MKVLTKLVSLGPLKLKVSIESAPKDDLEDRHVEDTKSALRGLGLDDDIKVE